MATQSLTAARLRELLHYEPSTGLFTWSAGRPAGYKERQGYVVIKVGAKRYLAHRLAWLHVHGVWPSAPIDHIDGAKANNAISNLREAHGNINAWNQKAAHANSRSGFAGVTWRPDKRKWQACITVDRKQRHLGYFATAEEGSRAYKASKAILHAAAM